MAEEQKKEAKKWGKETEGEKGQAKGEKKQDPRAQPKKLIQIVRVTETDLDGNKTVASQIKKIKGISHMLANAIAQVYPNSDKKVVDLSEQEIAELEEFVRHPEKHGIPIWMLNRRFDPESSVDRHLVGSDLVFTKNMDINKLKRMKSYKGVRHGLGLPVRGQRTRSSFRAKGQSVGVQKKKEQPAKAAPSKGGGK
ncbi:MAG: 30S ribosomal protein S13 [Candidatus Aenigmarchaeota archaeon]|nr:30S ribosomal protein S13 [Candidatus Aenigmarchaeota archaeon]